MDWSTLPEWLGLVEILAALVGGGILARSRAWLRARSRKTRGLSTGSQREPEDVRRSRRSVFRIPMLSATEPTRELKHYVATRGLVPIERHLHSSRIRAVWHGMNDVLFTTKSTPKQGFRITGWHCRPIPDSEPIPGGFVLALRLHSNENRGHLKMSMLAGALFSDRPRLVAIASIADLFDEQSWVRCYAVDVSTANLDDEDPELIGFQSHRGVRHEASTRARRRVCDVQEEAVWMIIDNPAHAPPDEDWCRSPAETCETQDAPSNPDTDPAELARVEDDYCYIRRRTRRMVTGRAILWLFAGGGPDDQGSANACEGVASRLAEFGRDCVHVLRDVAHCLCRLHRRHDWAAAHHLDVASTRQAAAQGRESLEGWDHRQPRLRLDGPQRPTAGPQGLEGVLAEPATGELMSRPVAQHQA